MGARAQTCKGADERRLAHAGAVDVRERVNDRASADVGVANDAVRAHAHLVAQAHVAFKNAADIDLNVLPAAQRAAHVQPRWVGQAHAVIHQLVGLRPLIATLQVSQLMWTVNTKHFGLTGRKRADDGHALRHGHGHDVGQIKLALHVVVLERHHPLGQQRRGRRHDAAVDLAYGTLRGCGVFVFDDAFNVARFALARTAQNSPVACGVTQFDG